MLVFLRVPYDKHTIMDLPTLLEIIEAPTLHSLDVGEEAMSVLSLSLNPGNLGLHNVSLLFQAWSVGINLT